MSTHEVKIIKVKNIKKHPNGDFLEIIEIDGYNCVVNKNQFKIGDFVAHLEPDTVVDTSIPEFAFLAKPEEPEKKSYRLTVRRFRGVYSEGLLVPAPKGFKPGDNAWEFYKCIRWEPGPTPSGSKLEGKDLGSRSTEKGPKLREKIYDLENIKKFNKTLLPGEEVIVTPKINGCNGRIVYSNGKLFVGSRNVWKKKPGFYFTNSDNRKKNKIKNKFFKFLQTLFILAFKNNPQKIWEFITKFEKYSFVRANKQNIVYQVSRSVWWDAVEQNPWIETWCKNNPDHILYGEVYGSLVQGDKFHYGKKNNEVGFVVFDIMDSDGYWIPNKDFITQKFYGLKFLPILYWGPFNLDLIAEFGERKETYNNANHIREGVVIKLATDRIDDKIGRVALKLVSQQYLLKS